eukprot:m.41576 g.41576  ORF g.41576 m.41576 type:complete len:131 (-) comp46198_c0_seq2:118-510(-)
MTAAELARRDGHEAIATLIEEHEHRLAQRNIKPALRAPRLPASPPEEPAQPDDASQVTGQQLIIFQFDQQLGEHDPAAGEIDALQPMDARLQLADEHAVEQRAANEHTVEQRRAPLLVMDLGELDFQLPD